MVADPEHHGRDRLRRPGLGRGVVVGDEQAVPLHRDPRPESLHVRPHVLRLYVPTPADLEADPAVAVAEVARHARAVAVAHGDEVGKGVAHGVGVDHPLQRGHAVRPERQRRGGVASPLLPREDRGRGRLPRRQAEQVERPVEVHVGDRGVAPPPGVDRERSELHGELAVGAAGGGVAEDDHGAVGRGRRQVSHAVAVGVDCQEAGDLGGQIDRARPVKPTQPVVQEDRPLAAVGRDDQVEVAVLVHVEDRHARMPLGRPDQRGALAVPPGGELAGEALVLGLGVLGRADRCPGVARAGGRGGNPVVA